MVPVTFTSTLSVNYDCFWAGFYFYKINTVFVNFLSSH